MQDSRAITSNTYLLDQNKMGIVFLLIALGLVALILAILFPDLTAASDVEQQIAISNLRNSLDQCTVRMVSLEQATNLTKSYCFNAENRVNRLADGTKTLVVSALFFSAVLNAALVYFLYKKKLDKKPEKEKPKEEEAKAP